MIKSIHLVNWRSHADTKLEFRKGTNLLVGIMGAGKSSILEGISFALFGTFPALERRKLKLENVVRLNEPIAKITLEFEWDGLTYKVERAIERSKRGTSSYAEVFRSNALVENGPVAVSSYIRNLTGVDYDLFTRAIYSEQNNIDYFLTLDPRRRKEEIDTLLGLDKFEIARSNIVAVINRVRSKRQASEERFSREKLSELSSKEGALTSETSSMEAKLSGMSQSYELHVKKAESVASEFEGMRKAKELFDNLDKESLKLATQLETMRKELEGKTVDETALADMDKKALLLGEQRAKLNASLRASDQHISALSKEAGSIEARLKAASEAKAKAATMEAELTGILGGRSPDDIQKLQRESEQSLVSLDAERRSLERELTDISEAVARLKPGLSECPLCSSKLTDSGIEHVKEEKNALISKKRSRLTELAAEGSARKKEVESLREKARRSSILSEKMLSLKQEADNEGKLISRRAEIESGSSKAAEEKRTMQAEMDSLSNSLESLRLALNQGKAIAERAKESIKVEARLSDTRSKLSALTFDQKAFDDLRKSAEDSRLELEKLRSAKAAAETQLKLTSDMLKLVREELGAMNKMGKEIASLASLDEQLSIYKNALLETQTGLRLSLTDAINSAMNEVWTIFYPYRNYHALRLGVTEKDYLFEVDDGAGWKSLESIASGGERACAALALRVALAMVLTPKLSWLILDEPTHNLDSEAVEMLSSALQFKVPEVVKQTFVITHDEAFMGSDFASSYRLRRDKEHNGDTKIDAT